MVLFSVGLWATVGLVCLDLGFYRVFLVMNQCLDLSILALEYLLECFSVVLL